MNATRRWLPRGWSTLLAMAAVCAIDFLIGSNLESEVAAESLLDEEAPIVFVIDYSFYLLLLVPSVVFWLLGWLRALRITTFLFAGLVTLGLLLNVVGLVYSLDSNTEAYGLLWDAGLLWTNNVLIFSIWYWLLDSGGPEARADNPKVRADVAFPQQSTDYPGWENWRPAYFDYLFLAFSHSTAFSPTDTVILARKIKFLIMVQALISLIILAMLAARAINIIQSTPPAG
jgi:hypothetical protein